MLSVHVRQRFALQDLAGGQEPTEHARCSTSIMSVSFLVEWSELSLRLYVWL